MAGASETEKSLSFDREYCVDLDFDGNMGFTFDPSPDGIGVEENYEDTLGRIFGEDILNTYKDEGGLDNRAPSQVIERLWVVHPEVIPLARRHLARTRTELESVMPRTRGYLDLWDTDPLKAATEVYIRQDLISSLGHLGLEHDDGTLWPRPCTGFDDFWRTLQQLNRANLGFHITTAVISSGYDEYIQKVFDEVWGLPRPDIWVTDDTTRSRPHPADHLRRVKPAPFGIALAHQEWLKRYGLSGEGFDMKKVRDSKLRMVSFGDGAPKDGQMAARSRIGFGHFNRYLDGVADGEYTAFGDWRIIEKRLVDGVDALARGEPLAAVLGLKVPEIQLAAT